MNNKSSVYSINVWIQWSKYETNRSQLKKLKTAIKNKAGKTLRMSLKMFDGVNLPHELLLTTTQNQS